MKSFTNIFLYYLRLYVKIQMYHNYNNKGNHHVSIGILFIAQRYVSTVIKNRIKQTLKLI